MGEGSPRRRPSAGGYARGAETRSRIIDAALQVFGAQGYERASTRQIADAAGVKAPALQYYFDSKEGLHRACAERLLERSQPLCDVLARLRRSLPDLDARGAVAGVCDILDALVDMSLRADVQSGKSAFMSRLQSDASGPGLALLRERLITPLQATSAELVAKALGAPDADAGVRLRTSLLLSQGSALAAAREHTLRFLGWSEMSAEHGDEVKAAIRMHTTAALAVPLQVARPAPAARGPLASGHRDVDK